MSKANLVTPSSKLPPYVYQEFPAMYWHADGTFYVAKAAADVIAGTTPYNPLDKERAAAAKAAAASASAATGKPTLNKAETIANLAAGQIPHDIAASHKSLYELLLSGVKNALSEAGIAYDAASTDAKALLGLFPKA